MRSRKCELCSNLARIHCGSDQANLCCECDSKVHGANFLVAKHMRTLLCCVCQSPTPWTGSGPKLGPTVSVCQTCLSATRGAKDVQMDTGDDEDIDNVHHGDGHQLDHEDDDDPGEAHDAAQNGDYDEEEEEEEEEDDEDNQVVPWSY